MDTKDVCLRPWEESFSLPEKFNMVSLYLDRHIEQGRGGRTAIYYQDRKYTYRDIFELTNRAGNAFAGLGVKKGDRVVMMMYDSPYWVAVYLGAMKIGAVPVPVNVLATPSNLAYFIEDSQASVLVVEQDLLEKIENMSSPGTKIVVRGEPGTSCTHLSKSSMPLPRPLKPVKRVRWTIPTGSTLPVRPAGPKG